MSATDKIDTGSGGSECDWGIVRYLPGSGDVPDEDIAAFDGWYARKTDAAVIYKDWCHQYPQFIVALVRQNVARWLSDEEGCNP